MPTAPDPNSPYMDGRVQAEFGREPGTPSSVGKPGPQAADFSFPAPPAPASAPPGRPAAPAQPAPTPGAPALTAGAAPPTTPAPTTPMLPTAPGAAPMLPPGTLSVNTVGADGTPHSSITPEGDQRYRLAVVALREKLGPMPKVMRNPGAPELPVELGKWNYNPFTGQYSK
jgi:hypothetical protein